MASKRMGRPVDGYPLIFFNVSIGLHPIRHAHIIAKISAAPKGKKSAVIVEMMEHGSITPAAIEAKESEPASVEIDLCSDGL